MIRVRKHNGDWQVRWRRCEDDKRCWHWETVANLYDLQQTIIEFAVHIDNYIRIALEVMQGNSETYLYKDGELTRRQSLQSINVPEGQYFCMTMHLRHHDEIEETIKLIESGVWKVRKWLPPPTFANRYEFRLSQKSLKREYLIVETVNDLFVPFEIII